MRYARLVLVMCALAILAPGPARAAPQRQTIDCDIMRLLPSGMDGFLIDLLRVVSLNSRTVKRIELSVGGAALRLDICASDAQSGTASRVASLLEGALRGLSAEPALRYSGPEDLMLLLPDDGSDVPSTPRVMVLPTSVDEYQMVRTAVQLLFWPDRGNSADDRWIGPGYAGFLTERALAAAQPGEALSGPPVQCGESPLSPAAGEAEELEGCMARRGAQVFADIERTIGASRLITAMHVVHEDAGPATSWRALVALERGGREDLADLMRGRVFGRGAWDALAARQGWRQSLFALEDRGSKVGIVPPPQLRDAIDTPDPAAEGWLAALEGVVGGVEHVESACAASALACERIWQPLPGDLVGLAGLGERLGAAGSALDAYGELTGEAAVAPQVAVPASLTALVSRLDPGAGAVVAEARQALASGSSLDRLCAQAGLAASCGVDWRASWAAGDFASVARAAQPVVELLERARITELRCGAALDACRAIWQSGYARGAAVASAEIDRLSVLLDEAESVTAACAQAGWPCATGWHAAIGDGIDPALATLAELRGALPALQQGGAALPPPEGLVWLLDRAPLAGSEGLLGRARAAFAAGGVAEARALLAQSQEARQRSSARAEWLGRYGWLIALALLALAVAASMWYRQQARRRRDAKLLANLLGM